MQDILFARLGAADNVRLFRTPHDQLDIAITMLPFPVYFSSPIHMQGRLGVELENTIRTGKHPGFRSQRIGPIPGQAPVLQTIG